MFSKYIRSEKNSVDEEPYSPTYSRTKFASTGLRVVEDYLDLDHEENHMVLDLSCARQSVFDFCSRYNCVYLVANAGNSFEFSRITDYSPYEDNDPKEYADIFRNVLSNRTSIGISVILVWDFFNYMERHEVISLMEFLSPHCRQGAKLFAISWLTETIPSRPSDFDTTLDGEIIYELTSNETITSPEYTAQSLVDMMPSFAPHKLSVTRSGMLEVLLEFKGLKTAPNPYVIPSATLKSLDRV